MTNVQTKLTYADYMKTPDDEHCELLHGELVMFTTPPIYHQEVLGSLLAKLAAFEREYHPGQFYPVLTDVVLSDRDVVKPDILFVSNERSHILTRENVRGAPDLVVEILSPATAERDRTVKLDLYAQYGVQEYWIVDPDAKTITVLLRGESRFEVSGIYGEGQSLRSPMLAGFSVALEEIF